MSAEIRFTELIKKAGNPEVMTLWADPKKDAAFMKLVKQRRILTVIQKPTGTKKDFGQIGFHPQPFATYVVFPKPLPDADAAIRVIGIKYELLQDHEIKPGVRFKPTIFKPKVKEPPPEIDYSITIRRQAATETTLTIRAENEAEAKAQALKEISQQPFSPSPDEIEGKILSVKK